MKMLRTLATALTLAAASLPAAAAPITWDFSVAVSTGPLAGNTYAGYFTYDSSIVVPGGTVLTTNLFTDLDFVFGGTTYTEANTQTAGAIFDAAGMLSTVLFGTSCSPGTCATFVGVDSFALLWSKGSGGFIQYALVGSANTRSPDSVTMTQRVPEPASLLALAAAGLAGFGGRRLARRRAAHA